MKKRLPDILEEMRLALLGRRKNHQWGQSAKDAYHASLSGLRDAGSSTLEKTASSLNEALPFIDRAGYTTNEIEIGLGLSPKVVAHLELREHISEEEQHALIEETRQRKVINTILSSLFKAAEARDKLKFNDFHYTHLELEVSILPTVSLKFRPDGSKKKRRFLPTT